MHILTLSLIFLFSFVNSQNSITCVNKCSCEDINPTTDILQVFGPATNCCDVVSTGARGNVVISGTGIECTLCPSLCDTVCELSEVNITYTINVTRPAAGTFLFTVTAPINCPGTPDADLSLFFTRGSSIDGQFITVDPVKGEVSIVIANSPNEIRSYSASVKVDLYYNSDALRDSINVPFAFTVYDAIEPNATEYTAETTNSRVGGLYLFTVGTDTPGFNVDYSIKPLIGDPNYISINSTAGHTFTSSLQPPLTIREYVGVILMSYTSQSDSSLSGVVEVQFTFTIVYPLTPSPSSHDVIIPFPPIIPQDILALTITYSFFQGFSLSSFTYDLIDTANILNIDHTTGRFSFSFDNITEVKRYPDSGNTGIIISYFSREKYLDDSNKNEPVYKGSLSADYSIHIVDPCGFSEETNSTCENEGLCEITGLTYNCDCTDFFEGPTCGSDTNECSNATFCNTGQCTNTFGDFSCNCTHYYTGETCFIDVNECDFVPSICVNEGVCSNSIGRYSCDCSGTGYEGENCQEDNDECIDDVNLCVPGVCSNTDGSFLCNCSGTGHRGDLCEQEINECAEQPGICQNGNCTNNVGSYTCNCISGYTGRNCEANIDECTMDATLCNPGVCLDTYGSYYCDCTGTGFDGDACTDDINECSSVPSVCLNSGECVNTIGDFSCNCAGTGYTGRNCSIDINECLLVPPVCENNASCINIAGQFSCDCAGTGYEGENCETNINECNVTADICGTGECMDTDGSYFCVCDDTGFAGTNCENDINECDQPNVCQNGGNCSNSVPFYSCDCDDTGYDGANCQVDINECLESSICNNGNCSNNNGSFSCVCDVGYTGPLCQFDIVECDTVDVCNNGSCNNSPGSFSCSCLVGYTGQLCDEDVNECTSVPTLCSPGTCSNLFGSYNCDCTDTGYRGVNCTENINECSEDIDICNHGNCTDLDGTFSCDCFQGFTGANCSTNINECDVTAALCNNGTCIDTEGSYECMCTPGITGDNCETDVNECLDNTLCAPGDCMNTLGNYTCDCSDTGYEGRNCSKDIDECVDAGFCGLGDCENEPGSFSCNCTETGFTGTHCETDIDECTTLSPCSNSGTCFNTPGSYQCDCIPGFTGSNCEEDINECSTVNICNQGTCVNNIGSYSCSCPADTTGANCNITVNGTAFCPANMECTSDSDCMTCLCHRNFSYIKPVSVLLSSPLEFDGDQLLPFEREIQPEIVRDVTIFAKLNQTSFDQGYVMFIGSSTVYRNLGLYLDSNSSTAYLFYTQAGADSYTTISVPLNVVGPSIHTLAVVLNFVSGEASFYQDGVLVGTPPLTGLPDYKLGEKKNSRMMFVGGRIENLFKFTGWMEYVFLYPFCLSQQQITTLHNEGPISYDGTGRCRDDVSSDVCVPRPFYNPSVPTQHHTFATKTRCDPSQYSSRDLSGMYTCSQVSNAQECSVNSDCSSGYACGEYLSRDGHSLLPAVFDPYFHGFKYALVEQETYFSGSNPITISITKRPILTLDLTIFVKFQQVSDNEGYVVAKGVSAHARDFGLYLRGTSDTVWFVYKSKTGFHEYAIFSDIIVDDGLDHTMAAVLLQADNSRFVYLYVDGIPRGCVKIKSRVVFTPEINRLTVGGRPGTENFNFDGIIYKLHIYDVALGYSVISDLHNAFSNDLLVRYCTPLQSAGDSCYIERRPPFFKCDSDLGCVPTPYFNRTHPVLPQQDICYGVPYSTGQCLSCNCPTSNEPVCGTNGVTYANDCFLTCAGAALLTQGACLSYSARFDLFAGGSE